MTKENLFQSKSGIGFADIKELVGDAYTLKRTSHNNNKYILTDKDGNEQYFRFILTMKEFYEAIEDLGLIEFLKKYKIESVEPVKKKAKEKAAKKEARKIYKEQRKKKIQDKKISKCVQEEYDIIKQKKDEVGLKIMNMDLVRGSKEHMKLRAELHSLHDQLIATGIHQSWAETNLGITTEEMVKLRKKGEEKKKKAKEKKDKKVTLKLNKQNK